MLSTQNDLDVYLSGQRVAICVYLTPDFLHSPVFPHHLFDHNCSSPRPKLPDLLLPDKLETNVSKLTRDMCRLKDVSSLHSLAHVRPNRSLCSV